MDLRVVDVDERVSGLLGLSARQRRMTWEEALGPVHPEDRERLTGAARESIRRTGSLSSRFRVVHPDGSVHWLSTVGHALEGADGGTDQVVGFTMPSP
nr:PAS domain-containing protein [Kineococcus aurantiacus]